MRKLVLVVLGLCFSGLVMATEEPQYTLIDKEEDFELRAYAPMIVAETWVPGDMDAASSTGFRRIADFIFGNNTAKNGGATEIAMTAPVTLEPRSEKIDMTAPVSIEQTDGNWRVHFVMPSQYNQESLPKPNNPEVTLRAIPASNYAVVRFSGLAGEASVAENTRARLVWLAAREIEPKGPPQLARYNPPWTLPFLRRNEVMVPY